MATATPTNGVHKHHGSQPGPKAAPPRRIGSFPWFSASRTAYQLECWDLGTAAGTKYFVTRGGLYASTEGFDRRTLDGAQPCSTAETAKALCLAIETRVHRPEQAGPVLGLLLVRSGDERYYLEEQPGGGWRVSVGGTEYLGSDDAPFEVFEFPTAADAQAAVEKRIAERGRPRVLERLERLVADFRAGSVAIAFEPAATDGSFAIAVRSAGGGRRP